jgi:hypothetical protein
MAKRKNRAEQRKRRKRNNKDVERQKEEYVMIDGNITHYPYAYCRWHKGYMTKNMMKRHGCDEKCCQRLETLGTDKVAYA